MVDNNLKVWPFIEAKKLLKRFENSEKKESTEINQNEKTTSRCCCPFYNIYYKL